MGESAAQTMKEIEETRERLSSEIDDLAERLPGVPAWTKRMLRIATGGGVGAWALLFLLKRLRGRSGASSATPVHVDVNLVPEPWLRTIDGRSVKRVAFAAGAAWLFVRLVEIRRIRELERAIRES